MTVAELAQILSRAPQKLLDSTFVGTFQHNPTEVGVLARAPGRNVSTLWNFDPTDDPEWAEFDESVIPPE